MLVILILIVDNLNLTLFYQTIYLENLILGLGTVAVKLVALGDNLSIHFDILNANAVIVRSRMRRLQVKTINRVWHLRLSLSHLTKRGTSLIGRVLGIKICRLREIHHVVTVDKV